jgi:hypothetical protein
LHQHSLNALEVIQFMKKIRQSFLSEKEISEFKSSLVCTLSLSSKELFHSNMIGWLLENNLDFARKFFNSENIQVVEKVEREKNNFDLLVTVKYQYDKQDYVIENKVKSLPEFSQIQNYIEKAGKLKIDANFIYLSLITPGEEFRNSLPYLRFVSYDVIHDLISKTETQSDYVNTLLKDYQLLIHTLIKIKDFSEIKDIQSQLSFDLVNEKILRALRMFDVAQKIRFNSLGSLIDKKLEELPFTDLKNLKEKTEVGLTRSLGLLSVKFGLEDTKDKRNLLIGIQIQADQYRLSIEATDGSDVDELANILKKEGLWLNPDNEKNASILKFGKNFKYSYSSIKGITVEELTEKVKDDVTRLFKNFREMERLNLVKRPLKPIVATSSRASESSSQSWSENLKQETREAISEMRVTPSPDGKIYFKSRNQGSAFMYANDLMSANLSLFGAENEELLTKFTNVDELLASGWVID